MSEPIISVKKDQDEVISHLCKLVEEKAEAILSQDSLKTFHIGLSGGSLVKFLCAGLPSIKTDWSRWRLFFCDERLVPEESPDSTWGAYKSGLIPVTPLTESNFLVVNTSLDAVEAAADYQLNLIQHCGGNPPRLDVLLLGAGPDGHTCSLFPGHPLLDEPAPPEGRIVAPIVDSPKPPPTRVTLTLPVVNSADCCVFAATGEGKAETMARLLGPLAEGEEPLPARRVRPRGDLHWILDQGAAKLLNI